MAKSQSIPPLPKKGNVSAASDAIGAAKELVQGEPQPTPCYGTYVGDMPDQNFRFKIAIVEHDDAFKMHSHEYSELVVVLSGRAIHLTGKEDYPLEAGDVFVISGDMRHGFGEAQGLRLCNIMYDPKQFLDGISDLRRMMGYHALFDLEPRTAQVDEFKKKLHLSPEDMLHVTSLISTMKGEYEGAEDGRETAIRCTFQLLVAFLARRYQTQKEHTGTPLVRMAKVISHIQKNFREPLRIEDLAQIANLSASQFQRTFKRVYDTTPVNFINQVRIHRACELLKNPNLDITTVALETGYSSSSFFSTQFRRMMNESPSAYRQKQTQIV